MHTLPDWHLQQHLGCELEHHLFALPLPELVHVTRDDNCAELLFLADSDALSNAVCFKYSHADTNSNAFF